MKPNLTVIVNKNYGKNNEPDVHKLYSPQGLQTALNTYLSLFKISDVYQRIDRSYGFQTNGVDILPSCKEFENRYVVEDLRRFNICIGTLMVVLGLTFNFNPIIGLKDFSPKSDNDYIDALYNMIKCSVEYRIWADAEKCCS